jgi:hypothetical protein
MEAYTFVPHEKNTGRGPNRRGVDVGKLKGIWAIENSKLYSLFYQYERNPRLT